MSNYLHTSLNAKKFTEGSKHLSPAKLLKSKSFTYQIIKNDRPYSVVIEIITGLDVVDFRLFPGITCSPASKEMMGQYISRINSLLRTSCVKMSENREIYAQTIQGFKNGPLTIEMFEELEKRCFLSIEPFVGALQKVANCILLSSEEAEPQKLLKSSLEDEMSKAFDKMFENLLKKGPAKDEEDDDDDDDDNDEEEDKKEGDPLTLIPPSNDGPTLIPPFSELWKRHLASLRGKEPSSVKSSLFDELNSLDDEIDKADNNDDDTDEE